MRTPEELERLMWSVAEGNDPAAIEEFAERFPHLRGELVRRIEMVRQLRGAARAPGARPVPSFQNRPLRPQPVSASTWVGSGLALAAVAAAAFVVTRSLSKTPARPLAPVVVNTNPAPLPTPPVNYKAPAPTVPKPVLPPSEPSSQLAVDEPSAADKPQYVKFDSIRLLTALRAVAASGGLVLETAPNMPNPLVRIEYRDYTPIEILRDLGPRFGFTAFNDGPHKVLVVPARDRQAPASGGENGVAEPIPSKDLAAGRERTGERGLSGVGGAQPPDGTADKPGSEKMGAEKIGSARTEGHGSAVKPSASPATGHE